MDKNDGIFTGGIYDEAFDFEQLSRRYRAASMDGLVDEAPQTGTHRTKGKRKSVKNKGEETVSVENEPVASLHLHSLPSSLVVVFKTLCTFHKVSPSAIVKDLISQYVKEHLEDMRNNLK